MKEDVGSFFMKLSEFDISATKLMKNFLLVLIIRFFHSSQTHESNWDSWAI